MKTRRRQKRADYINISWTKAAFITLFLDEKLFGDWKKNA